MMKYALVEGERICEFADDAKGCFPVATGLQWAAVADDATTFDQYVGGKVVKYLAPAAPPAPVFIAKTKAEKLAALLAPYGLTAIDLKAELN